MICITMLPKNIPVLVLPMLFFFWFQKFIKRHCWLIICWWSWNISDKYGSINIHSPTLWIATRVNGQKPHWSLPSKHWIQAPGKWRWSSSRVRRLGSHASTEKPIPNILISMQACSHIMLNRPYIISKSNGQCIRRIQKSWQFYLPASYHPMGKWDLHFYLK
jgi:hypothetical protein